MSHERVRVSLASEVLPEDRKSALQSLKEAREQLLPSADALNDQLQDAKLRR